ncbi:MAG: hypothetical protein DRJ31_04970 [Candidatus Methanomethylicota archaeon]|uniref:DNA-(apurinic or apyrimidinic site) lyase n=1 Tax=Thermoproteota archaeon TaxID=2056631 RepID=A0A497EQM3_9CREN|nr:MAG: hypothetical protein DRJ31_04970 [Candidatus Verstraetearchaeota archaeon]
MILHRRFSIIVEPAEGYDFHLTARAYALPGEYDGVKARIPIFEKNSLAIAEVTCLSDGKLSVTCYSNTNIEKSFVEEKVRHVLAFDEDLSEYHAIIRGDPVLNAISSKFKGLRMKGVSNLWNAMLIAFCQQNASFKQGWRMYRNIVYNMGLKVGLEGGVSVFVTPSPAMVVEQGLAKLREQGLGYRANYVLEAAKVFVEEESFEEKLSEVDVEAYAAIKKIRGLGVYSGRLALLLAQRRYSLTPLDRWTIRILSEIYAKKRLSLTEAEEEAKRLWGKWSGLSVYFMTIVLDAEVISKALQRIAEGRVEPSLCGVLTPMTLWQYSW